LKIRIESAPNLLTAVSYNLHGLNQGISGIKELMDGLSPDVIMVQEHWQTTDNLHRLSDISDNYFMFGSSAMDTRVGEGPLSGRPFGGTAILIKNKFSGCAVSVATGDRFTVVKVTNWLIICVYLPCTGSDNRLLVYGDTLHEIQSIIAAHNDCDCLIGGDFNTDLNIVNELNTTVNNFIADNNLYRCDVILPVASKYTYINESLNCSSTIDYMLTSNPVRTVAFNLLDIDVNLSDHIPIMTVCSRDDFTRVIDDAGRPTAVVSHFRWDHAPLDKYYEQTRVLLDPVDNDLNVLIADCHKMSSDCVADEIDKLYDNVVSALQSSANLFIPKRKQNFYKFWWNQELDELKNKSIASCRLWKDAGKPNHGQLHAKYKQDKQLYKKRLREERTRETSAYTNELHDALMHKSGQAFWKTPRLLTNPIKFGKWGAQPTITKLLITLLSISSKSVLLIALFVTLSWKSSISIYGQITAALRLMMQNVLMLNCLAI